MLFRRVFMLSIVFLGWLSLATTVSAQQATARETAGRLIEVKVTASTLKGNLLNDPAEQSVSVYLPPSYESSPARRFPSLYLLHGFLGNNKAWTSNGYQGMSLQPLMDQMIKSGKIREMIVVVPNGWNAYRGSFYTNSTVTGNWEDYIARELVQSIDTNYRTMARSESRGIAGHSMGGYGALSLAMKHPDVFSAVYALSPCCLGMEGDFNSDNPAWVKTLRLTSREQLKSRPASPEDFYQMAFIAISAAFSPNPAREPFYVDFPFQERDGRVEKTDATYARWRAKMPLYMVDENKENLLKLRGIFIDYGQNEQFSHIRLATALFSKALADRSIPHIFEIYEGGDHGNKVRQRVETRMLQFFSDRLEFSSPN
jgi:S-formylglutathione hydrolase